MKMLKTALVWMLVVAFCVAMIGCTQEEPATETNEEPSVAESTEETVETEEPPVEETYTLGLAMHGLSSEYGRLLADAEVAACEAMGFEYDLMDPDFDVNTQIGQIETLITNQVDGILITPVDSEACVAAVEKIHDAGIPCVVVNMLVNTDKYDAYVGSNDVSVGEDILNWIADKIGGEGNIVIMEGIYGFAAQIQRLEGIEKALENYPDINVLDMQTANWSRAEGMTLMENWLQTYGDEIDAIIGENDEMAIGAMQAIIAQNIDKKIWVVGIDGLADAKNGIKDGTYDCTFFQNAVGQGSGGVEVMAKILNGGPYDKELWIPFEEINADNVDDYM